jgi:hypothetical protein
MGSHAGQDHRVTTTGASLDVTAQWLSLDTDGNLATTSDPRVFLVLQRVNYDSSHAAYDGAVGRVHVAMADDLVYLGPFEGDIHVDNPLPGPVRARFVDRARRFGSSASSPASAATPMTRPGSTTAISANTRGRDGGSATSYSIRTASTATDLDRREGRHGLAETVRQAELAQRIGIETFVLDDGWQAASGDWCPDSPDCPSRARRPRLSPTASPTASSARAQRARAARRDAPRPLDVADAVQSRPRTPTGQSDLDVRADRPRLVLYNTADPDSSSNEAGLGTWDPRAIGPDGVLIEHIESRIRRAIDVYGARYFKFDFLAWVDCAVARTRTSSARSS